MAKLHRMPCPACDGEGKQEYTAGHPLDPYASLHYEQCYLCSGGGEIAYWGRHCDACENQRVLPPHIHEPGVIGREFGLCDFCQDECDQEIEHAQKVYA